MPQFVLDTVAPAPQRPVGPTQDVLPADSDSAPLTVLEPPSGWQLINLRELWQYRELFYYFTWRDVKVRYKQTVLGAAWAIIQPFMMMVVFTIFLGRMANVDSGGVAYPVFVYAGLLPWTFFATAISNAGNSVVSSQSIITKIYFPRLLVPFVSVGAAIVDFLIAFSVLIVLMYIYRIQPTWSVLLVFPLTILIIMAALGIGSLLAALNVAYRDFKYTIGFLVQIWMFATPTIYMNVDVNVDSREAQASNSPTTAAADSTSSSDQGTASDGHKHARKSAGSMSSSVKSFLPLNPMTGLIGFFRAAVLGGPLPWKAVGYSTLIITVLLVLGTLYFRHVEARFADII